MCESRTDNKRVRVALPLFESTEDLLELEKVLYVDWVVLKGAAAKVRQRRQALAIGLEEGQQGGRVAKEVVHVRTLKDAWDGKSVEYTAGEARAVDATGDGWAVENG